MKKLLVLLFIFCSPVFSQTPGTSSFPGSLDNDTNLPITADNAQTTLNALLSSTTTSFSVASTSSFPSPALVWIESEEIFCSSVSGGVFSSCTRSLNGVVSSHASGTSVQLRPSSAFFEGVRQATKNIESKIGICSSSPLSGSVLYSPSDGCTNWLSPGSEGQVLTMVSGLPAWSNGSTNISSLNGLTSTSQTFVNDSNITITSSGSTHTIGWSGNLPVTRGGTGTTTAFTTGNIVFAGSGGAYSQNSNLFWDTFNSRLGIGTTTPTNTLSFGNTLSAIIGVERNTSGIGTGAGKPLNIIAGAAKVLNSDTNGGTLTISGGVSTGSGSSRIDFGVYKSSTPGTSDNSQTIIASLNSSGFGLDLKSGAFLKYFGSTSGSISISAPSSVTSYSVTWPNSIGSSGNCLSTDGVSALSWSTCLSGAVGSDTQIIYNSSGTLVGNSNLTYDGNTFTTNGASISNTGVGSNLVSSWDNTTGFNFSTFSSSGANITSAISTGGLATSSVTDASVSLSSGNTYKVCFTFTLNSGLVPTFSVGPTNIGGTPKQVVFVPTSGYNCSIFTSSVTATDFAIFSLSGPTNFSVSGFSLNQITSGTGNLIAKGTFQSDSNALFGRDVNVGGTLTANTITTPFGSITNSLGYTNTEVFGGNFQPFGSGSAKLSGQAMVFLGNNLSVGNAMDDSIIVGSNITYNNAQGIVLIGEGINSTVGSPVTHFSWGSSFSGPPVIVGSQSTGLGTSLGFGAQTGTGESVAIGPQTRCSGLACVAIGDASRGTHNSISVGDVMVANGNINYIFGGGIQTNHDYVVCLGCVGDAVFTNSADPSTANGQGYFGWYNDGFLTANSITGSGFIKDWRFGTNQSQYIFSQTLTVGSGGQGTNIAGGDAHIRAGEGTGNGTPGSLYFSTTTAGSSGTTKESFTDRMQIDGAGNVILLGGTDLQIKGSSSGTATIVAPSAAGTPTLTLPTTTGTIVTDSSTATLTNKTFDSAGTGNSLAINGTSITSVIGSGSVVLANRSIVAKTANYTVVSGDVTKFFTNTGATGEVDFTLPTPVAGMRYSFYVDAAQTVKVIASGSATINVQGTVSSTNGNTSIATNGAVITLIAIDSTHWVCESRPVGNWVTV